MKGLKVSMDFVANEEDVARMLFSPLFICDGILSQKAFTLEAALKETSYSELRLILSKKIWRESGKKATRYMVMRY